MKRIIQLFIILLIVSIQNAKASIFESFMFKPAFTLELQHPEISADGKNDDFENRIFEQQLARGENLVLGMNLRLHKYFGINGNWSKFLMKNEGLEGYTITQKSDLEINNFNVSSLFYLPLIGDNLFEAFAEIGISDINSTLEFTTANGLTINKSHQTALLYGGGIQFFPYESDFAFRFSVLKHNADIPIINASIITYRLGFIKYF